jgi:hypothetical protein
MSYIDKYKKIRPFVKLNIPHNKKMFSTAEKNLISKYYNKLEPMGFFNREQEGFILKDISRSKYKIKNAPRIKSTFVNVGTRLVDGKITTDTTAKIKIINGQINIKRQGMPYKWEFEYNIKKDWKLKDFREHLREQMRPRKHKAGQIFIIGAGIYEMRGSGDSELDNLAKEILKMAHKYNSMIDKGQRNESQAPEHFMYRIIVYESHDAFKLRLKDVKKRKKKSHKGKR